MFQRKKWARLDLWEWTFLVVSILNITLCIILSTLRLENVVQHDPNSPDFIFTIMLIINSGMQYKSQLKIMFIEFIVIMYLGIYCFYYCCPRRGAKYCSRPSSHCGLCTGANSAVYSCFVSICDDRWKNGFS